MVVVVTSSDLDRPVNAVSTIAKRTIVCSGHFIRSGKDRYTFYVTKNATRKSVIPSRTMKFYTSLTSILCRNGAFSITDTGHKVRDFVMLRTRRCLLLSDCCSQIQSATKVFERCMFRCRINVL